MLVIRYGVAIVGWTRGEMQKPNRKIRKLLTLYGIHHPKAGISWLYLKRDQNVLTIMYASTCIPEAIPLWNVKAKTIVRVLVKFFTFVGLPTFIQFDQGSNFMSGLFQQVMHELGIKQVWKRFNWYRRVCADRTKQLTRLFAY